MSTAVAGKGLEGIVAANSTGICWIDGEAGVLAYRGIDIHELAVHSTFEEDHLPALERHFAQRAGPARVSSPSWPWPARARRPCHRLAQSVSHHGNSHGSPAHRRLRRSVSTTPTRKTIRTTPTCRKSYNLVSQVAMLVAVYDRIRKGLEIVPPDRSLSHAGNFLWMLTGEKPSETATRTLDIALILHADHGIGMPPPLPPASLLPLSQTSTPR